MKIIVIIINLEQLVVLSAGPSSASVDMSFSLGLCFLHLFSLKVQPLVNSESKEYIFENDRCIG